MTDADRLARNMTRLGECYYVFQGRVSAILKQMEKIGWRPRIQDAYRTPEVQEGKKLAGVSRLARGFHNLVGVTGRPESLAVDILNDDDPVWPAGWQEDFPTLYQARLRFVLDLARAAAANGCRTGVSWGLDTEARVLVQKAVAGQREGLKTIVGWDPLHVEPADVTVAAALDGARPKAMAPAVAGLAAVPLAPSAAVAPSGPTNCPTCGRAI